MKYFFTLVALMLFSFNAQASTKPYKSIQFFPCIHVNASSLKSEEIISGKDVVEYIRAIKFVDPSRIHPAHSLLLHQDEDGFEIFFRNDEDKVCYIEKFTRDESIRITVRLITNVLTRIQTKIEETQEILEKTR